MEGMTATLAEWPALYNPQTELRHLEHTSPIQPNGRYLYDPHDIFVYTFYWTLIFYTPAFVLCAAYAFANLAFLPAQRMHRVLHKHAPASIHETHYHVCIEANSRGHSEHHLMLALVPPRGGLRAPRAHRSNERRSRLTFALLVVLVYLFCSLAGAVLSSIFGGYILAGLFKAGGYNMSTWIPCLYALVQTLVGTLSLWPSVIDII